MQVTLAWEDHQFYEIFNVLSTDTEVIACDDHLALTCDQHQSSGIADSSIALLCRDQLTIVLHDLTKRLTLYSLITQLITATLLQSDMEKH